jgi:hypothetical protein
MPHMINPADIKKEQDKGYSSFIPGPFLPSDDDDDNASTVSHSTDGNTNKFKFCTRVYENIMFSYC